MDKQALDDLIDMGHRVIKDIPSYMQEKQQSRMTEADEDQIVRAAAKASKKAYALGKQHATNRQGMHFEGDLKSEEFNSYRKGYFDNLSDDAPVCCDFHGVKTTWGKIDPIGKLAVQEGIDVEADQRCLLLR